MYASHPGARFALFAALAGVTLAGFTLAAPDLAAQELMLLTKSNRLLRADTGTPGVVQSSVSITGLQAGEDLLGIDFRPSTGELYGLGSTSRIYRIATDTGVATAVGMPFVPVLNGTSFGFDFNPTVDRIRVVSDADQDLRLHPDTGAVVAVDGTLAYAPTDPNAAINPNVVAAAYANNVASATTTTLYDIDSNLDVLLTQVPPNSGTLNTVGSLGVNVGTIADFDIAGTTKVAWAAFTSPGSGVTTSSLFTIDLQTGRATFRSTLAGGEIVTGMSVVPTPGAVQYGRATPGCFGDAAIGVGGGSPRLGNSAFAVKCVNAHPNTVGRLILGARDLQTPAVVLGASLFVDPLAPGTLWLPVATDAQGDSLVAMPVPSHPALENAMLFLQFAWLDRCARGGLAASNALALTILR